MTAGGLPSLSRKTLQEILLGVVDEIRADQEGFEFEIPRTPKGEVSTATEQWAELAEHHPFLRDWSAMAETSKLCQFFGGLQSKIVHPRYTTMVLTGRTSCSGPNIQQMPRKAGFREIFRPSPGHFLLAVDYKFIELVALAAICEARFGKFNIGRRYPRRPGSSCLYRGDSTGTGPGSVPRPSRDRSCEVQGMEADGQTPEFWNPGWARAGDARGVRPANLQRPDDRRAGRGIPPADDHGGLPRVGSVFGR